MPPYDDAWIEKVKEATDIVDVIGKKVELKASGSGYTGLCPFHEEKTPSFSVNVAKQFYYCFGCGAGGSVFNFMMNTENIPFPEAVRILAEQAEIPVPAMSADEKKASEKREQLFRTNHAAAQYFYRLLRSSSGRASRRYLVERGITGDLARQFYLGLAAPSWDGLLQFIRERQIPESAAEEAGLIVKGKKGYYDRFRNRIMFPICNERGQFLGFGGRVIGDGQPKYLNSPESAVFQKKRSLYGLNWAKESIREHDEVVVVEGYTDCIALAAKGVTNVVASLGTAFTDEHAKLLARFSPNVIIAFDGDAAGARATKKGIELLHRAGLKVQVAGLDEGDDPDSFSRAHTEDEVQGWLHGALPWVEYQIRTVLSGADLQTREGKLAASKEVVDIIKPLENAIERDEYVQFAAELLHIDARSIAAEVSKQPQGKTGSSLENKDKFPHIISRSRYTIKDLHKTQEQAGAAGSIGSMAEREMLRWLLAKPRLVEELQQRGADADQFENPNYRHLFSLLTTGTWDRHGEAVAEELYQLSPPTGKWEEFWQQFRIGVWVRDLRKIEEKLTRLEKEKGHNILIQIGQLIERYGVIRSEIFRAKDQE